MQFFKRGQKKDKKLLKKGQKRAKFKNILKKGTSLCAIITHNKLLEKALGNKFLT